MLLSALYEYGNYDRELKTFGFLWLAPGLIERGHKCQFVLPFGKVKSKIVATVADSLVYSV